MLVWETLRALGAHPRGARPWLPAFRYKLYLQKGYFFNYMIHLTELKWDLVWIPKTLLCHCLSLHFQNRGKKSKRLTFGKVLTLSLSFPFPFPLFLLLTGSLGYFGFGNEICFHAAALLKMEGTPCNSDVLESLRDF